MPQETLHFSCPFCGQHAPIERILDEGPFEILIYRKTLGGKRALSRDEKAMKKGAGFHRGSAPGALDYEEVPMTPDIQEAIDRRRREV